jgi:hypothetical protein
MSIKSIGESALGSWAKKSVGNIIGWGASLFGMGDAAKIAKTVTGTLETVGLAKKLFGEDASIDEGLMSQKIPTVSFEGMTYPKQKFAKGPGKPTVVSAEAMDRKWEMILAQDYYIQTRFTPKAKDIASQVTKIG